MSSPGSSNFSCQKPSRQSKGNEALNGIGGDMNNQTRQSDVLSRPACDLPAAAPQISCYIRTLNEERCIEEVVRAARNVAEEIIVVDSGSQDKTLELAQSAGAKIIQQPWLGNGFQKRVGEEAAKHNWVLDLDADEIVTAKLAEEIRQIFSTPPEYRLYEFKLVTVPPFGQPWWGFKRAHRVKLYDKSFIRIPAHAAWDQFKVPSGVEVGKLKQPLLHYAFTGIEHIVAKLNRTSGVRARETKLKPLWNVVLRVFFGLPIYFFKEYLLNGLIRGGVYGFTYALTLAFGRWMRDVKMYERHRQTSHG